MFQTKLTQPTAYTKEKNRLLAALADYQPESPEYAKILDQVSKLDKLESDNTPKPISNDTRASIAANLTGILLIINHERAGVIATKAMAILPRLR